MNAKSLDSAAYKLHFYLALLPKQFFYLFLDRSFSFSLPPYISPIALHLSPKPLSTFPCMVAPTLPSSTCAQVPISPRGSPVRGYLPPSACLHHPQTWSPLQQTLTGGPVPCRSRSVALRSSSPVPCASASPSSCSAPSLGVFWSLIPVVYTFVRKLEAWAPPLPENFSPKLLPPRYLAILAPFSLPSCLLMTCRLYVGIYVELRWQTDTIPCSPSGRARYNIIYY